MLLSQIKTLYGNNLNFTAVNNKNKKQLPFGCRIMAFVNPESSTSQERKDFIKGCLIDSKDSLKNQSIPNREGRDGFIVPLNKEDMSGALLKAGNVDGWGIVGYIKSKLKDLNFHSVVAAFKDNQFNKAVEETLSKAPEIILAHVRAASDPNSLNINNNHPFVYNNWSFEHNGEATFKNSKFIQNRLKYYEEAYGLKCKGTTDSEASFNYFLGKMKDKGLDLNSKDLNPEEVRKVFAETVKEILENSSRVTKKLDGKINGIVGELKLYPGINFVTSNGDFVLAFRKGAQLYLSEHRYADGKKEYVISSEAIQVSKTNKDIKWFDIPEDTVVMISKDKTGVMVPSIMPLEGLLN